MERNYIKINGISSLTITGLAIKTLPPIVKAPMRTLIEEIDGRNGDIITELGYGAYDKTIEIGLYGNYDIDKVIAFFNSKGTIEFSNELGKLYTFAINEQINYENLLKFKQAMFNIHIQPFKYPTTETPVETEYKYVEGTGETISLDNTIQAKMEVGLSGNTSQEGTPTPDSPQDIHIVSGNNTIRVANQDGTQYTDYPINLGNLELCKIGDYKDYFYKNVVGALDYSSDRELGAWYLKKNIGKVVLDGSEDWAGIADLGNNIRTYILHQNIKHFSSGYSNYFKIKTSGYETDETSIIYSPYTQSIIVLKIPESLLSSVDKTGIQNWLSNNNTTCYYLYITPTYTKITDTTLIGQLENVSKALSYKNQTNISQVNNDKPFIIDAKAEGEGSGSAIINNDGNIYAKPTISLIGTGEVNIYLDDVQKFKVDLSELNEITIDTNEMEAYTPSNVLANRKVIGNYETFKLDVGNSTLKFDGALTKATITKYKRWL